MSVPLRNHPRLFRGRVSKTECCSEKQFSPKLGGTGWPKKVQDKACLLYTSKLSIDTGCAVSWAAHLLMSLSHQEVFFPLQAPAVLPLKSVVFHSYHNLFLRHGQLWHGSGAECGGRRLKEDMENFMWQTTELLY